MGAIFRPSLVIGEATLARDPFAFTSLFSRLCKQMSWLLFVGNQPQNPFTQDFAVILHLTTLGSHVLCNNTMSFDQLFISQKQQLI